MAFRESVQKQNLKGIFIEFQRIPMYNMGVKGNLLGSGCRITEGDPMKHIKWNRLLALGLSVMIAASIALPAYAAGTEYQPEKGATHEIYWQKGVEAPTLTGDKADFQPQQVTLGQAQVDVLTAPYEEGKGWYDLSQEKKEDHSPSPAAANLLYWWLDQNSEYVDRYLKSVPKQETGLAALSQLSDLRKLPESNQLSDSALYQQLVKFSGAYADHILDAFLNGYKPGEKDPNEEDHFAPSSDGGFFYPVFQKHVLTSREKITSDALRSAMENSMGTIVTLKLDQESFLPVVVWGVEMDEAGELAAIYAADSMDELGMIRYDLQALETAGVMLENLCLLDLGTAPWESYFAAQGGSQEKVPTPLPQVERWSKPEYEWNDDYTKCTATRTDLNDSKNVETEEAETITSQITRKATCSSKGQTTYTAKFKADWAEEQKETVDNIPLAEHSWGEPAYSWADDYSSCTARRVCKADSAHVQSSQGRIQKAESNRGRTVTYTASFPDGWAKDQTHVEEIAPAEPDWGEVSYNWSSDYSSCTAKRTDRNDPQNVQTATAKVTSQQTKKPTCKQKGQTTYSAVFTESWAAEQKVTVENLDLIQPNWDPVTYEWSEDHHRCVATRKCKNEEDHVETAYGDVTATPNKKPTTTQMGQTKYVAEFRVSWAKTQTEIVEDVDVLEDRWHATQYRWSADYRSCTATRVNKSDSSIKETLDAKVTSEITRKATSTRKGETTYTAKFDEDWAENQVKVVANVPMTGGETEKPSDSKTWNAPTYDWSEDFSRCTASRSRKNDPSTVETARATVTMKEVQKPTCTVNGEAVYTAKFTEGWAKDQTTKARIPPIDHELKKVEETQASASHEGMKAHYECQVCHKLFADAKGQKEVSREELMLQKPAVSDGFAVVSGIPEKDYVIGLAPEKLSQALDQNPGAAGVSIAVGQITVTYDKVDVESILHQAKDAGKLQLTVYKTNTADSSMTRDQIQTMGRNETGSFYQVVLSYVKNGKSYPVEDLSGAAITVPYGGSSAVRAFEIHADGSVTEVSSGFQNGFVKLKSDNGLYMLTEQDPVGGTKKSGGKVGLIIWISVLVISGLACLGLGGFFLYQKMQEKNDVLEDSSFPRINKPVAPAKPKTVQKHVASSQPWDSPVPTGTQTGESSAPYTEENPVYSAEPAYDQEPVSYDTVPAKYLAGEAGNQTVSSYQGRYSGGKQPVSGENARETDDYMIHDPELDALLSQVDSAIAAPEAAAPAAVKSSVKHRRPPVSPTAPKAPMQGKPTIAERTAQAASHEKHSQN